MPNRSINSFIGEWNLLLFSAFIPQAWTVLLDVLAHQDLVGDIYEYWPPPGAMDDYIAPASESGTDLKHIIGPNIHRVLVARNRRVLLRGPEGCCKRFLIVSLCLELRYGQSM